LITFGLLLVSMALAQAAWPTRPITVIVAFPAGGGTDILARTIEPFLERYLDASLVIVNKPGAGGQVGFTALARATPDGYTIGFINLPPVLTIPIERDAGFTLADLEPIANMVEDPGAFNVHVDSPFHSLQDLIDYAKANPGRVTVGTSGVGSDDHIAMLLFEQATGVDLVHVPFAGAAPNRTALLGRHITVGSFNISEAADLIRAGKIRSLGQMAEERWEMAADVPTFREQGVDIVIGSERGFAAPKGVPGEILDRIAAAIEQTVNDPEFQEVARQQLLPLRYMPRSEFQAFLAKMNTHFKQLWETNPWVVR
jgi:tripartite-type tricarboxylate transporter receptor subunit TctC